MRFLAQILFLFFWNTTAHAAQSNLMQWGGDESRLDRKTHVVTLVGNAYFFRDLEVLRADLIKLNTETLLVHAEGRVYYQYTDILIRADAMDLNPRQKTGTMYNGNVSNGKFALRGAQIDQIESNRFKVKEYDYSTCHDCPNSWAMTGSSADVTIDGYAFIDNFAFKVRDVPVAWSPYMVIPLKTRRQSGFLFPVFGKTSDFGNYLVEPFYWAINRYSDMTFSMGEYTRKGARFEWEGRYAISPRSRGTANFYWTRDPEVTPLFFRWAAKTGMAQELPFGFEGKLHLNEVSDSGYPIRYSDDILGRQEAVLISDLFFSKNDPDISTTISFRRIRNLLRYTGSVPDYRFDPVTVQEFPRIVVTSNDRLVFGQRVAFGVETRFNRFTRTAGPFDTFTNNGTKTEIIREANRLTLIPSLYTTLNPKPWLSLVPSVQYRSFVYNFNGAYSNLARGYLLAQTEASLQLEKLYPTTDPDLSYRHTIRPTLTYSVIPDWGIIQSGEHPFERQVQSQGSAGKYFDDSDIVPKKTIQNLDNYFVPLGNSLTYGLTTQVFKREKQKDGSTNVFRRFEAGFSQTLDIFEVKRSLDNIQKNNRIILSPFFSHFLYANGKFSSSLEYTYYSFLERYDSAAAGLLKDPSPHRMSVSFSWTLESALKDGLLKYDRSLNATYSYSRLTSEVSSLQVGSTFSINDYIMPKGAVTYNLVKEADPHLIEVKGSLLFQSPSKCWQVEFGMSHSVDKSSVITPSIALNISGDSFGTLDDALKK